MIGLLLGLGVLLYIVLLIAGLAGRVNHGAMSAVRSIPGMVPNMRDCFSWITGDRVAFCLRLLLWLCYMVVVMGLLSLVYWTISSEGLRRSFPDLGLKLWRMPFLLELKSFRETRDLDLAHLVAIMLMLCSLFILHEVAKLQLGMETALKRHTRNLETYRRLVQTLGVVTLGIDLALFYLAVTEASWGSVFDARAFLVSVGYVCVLVVLTLGSILLEPFGKRRNSHESNGDDARDGAASEWVQPRHGRTERIESPAAARPHQ